ncbi:MAG: peptidoglycan editing factor PgeF [Gammaproteobacteria bacterium]|nr:peptidoglycan editing factor PgeF [Gammaproteobacteria bacterium]MCP5135843.1 peptidoglycan editing factor PgeF [Gammaproteobacteria bacterium]
MIRTLVPDWPAPSRIRSCTTLRDGGVSTGGYASLNLADHVEDDPAAVAENRQRLTAALGLPEAPQWLSQVHGVQVHRLAVQPDAKTPAADAVWTDQPDRICAVLTADCLPVLFCDRSASCVAAAHAGWRGLADGVLEATVAALPAAASELFAWMGPAIGPAVFEVGDEVREIFISRHPQTAPAFRPSPAGRWLADIYALARIRLAACGVHAVFGGGECTFSDVDRFYSFRREPRTGRMASLIWLQSETD